ncbi:hypothetical protein HDU87_004369 [Geranomyces variabilis]|uniref:Uncharacterized protein n=1 Tax=Geranomyces variabilis TaxID=109894 RepID=A0AAD5TIR5_9FUNG|nr:hypothetical protein HDU87_004369 [Geranomyces variabilis]
MPVVGYAISKLGSLPGTRRCGTLLSESRRGYAGDGAQELYGWVADLCAPSLQTVTTVGKSLSLFTVKIPGIYFLLVGKLGDVKTSMGLANAEPDNWLVVNAGKAVDLNGRLPDHRREFGNYQGSTLTIKGLMITERSELPTAENTIHPWLHGAGEKVEPEARRQLKDGSTKDVHNWSEIFVLPANKLTKAVQFMAAQQAHYCKGSQDLRDHINNLQAALKDKDNKFEKMQEVALALAKK